MNNLTIAVPVIDGLTPSSLTIDEHPPTHRVNETDDAFEVEVELPGVDKRHATVAVTGCVVVISARRSDDPAPAFHIELRLPATIAQDHCRASLVNGVLSLRLPKWRAQATWVQVD